MIATSTHRRRRLALLALAALVAFVFGVAWGKSDAPGPLRWDGTPRTGTAGDQQVLYGTLVNRAKTPVRVRSGAVRVLDGDGKALTAAAAFSDGYVPAAAGIASSATIVLRPGARLPLGVTWSGDASTIDVAGSRLAVPK
ncbi:MAG: hypothetical protein ACXVFK_18450 [Solirubrobacteraceae bacterium]